MDFSIYTVLGILVVIYLAITVLNRKRARRRKDRKFMDGYGRHRKKDPESDD